MGQSYSSASMKVKLKMANQRLTLHQSKRQNQLKIEKRKIAELLSQSKDESARIRVEGILRDEKLILVMEWLSMMCDLLWQRLRLIDSMKEPPADLVEAMTSVMYCAQRVDIVELTDIAKLLHAKYGKEWFAAHRDNRAKTVAHKIVTNLSVEPPEHFEKIEKLSEIAAEFGVDWEFVEEPDPSLNILGPSPAAPEPVLPPVQVAQPLPAQSPSGSQSSLDISDQNDVAAQYQQFVPGQQPEPESRPMAVAEQGAWTQFTSQESSVPVVRGKPGQPYWVHAETGEVTTTPPAGWGQGPQRRTESDNSADVDLDLPSVPTNPPRHSLATAPPAYDDEGMPHNQTPPLQPDETTTPDAPEDPSELSLEERLKRLGQM